MLELPLQTLRIQERIIDSAIPAKPTFVILQVQQMGSGTPHASSTASPYVMSYTAASLHFVKPSQH